MAKPDWINELANSFTFTSHIQLSPGDLRLYYNREKSTRFSGVAYHVEYSQLRDAVKQLTADQKQELANMVGRDAFSLSTSMEVLQAFNIDANRVEAADFAQLGAIIGLATEIQGRLNHMLMQ